MKKIFILSLVSLTLLGSVGASAIDKSTLKMMKGDNSTLWYFDKELQQYMYFKDGELVKNGFITLENGKKYYFKENGTMAIGWIFANNNWYYSTNNGCIKGWYNDNGKWYYLNSDGTMAHDTTVDEYYINSSGIWS